MLGKRNHSKLTNATSTAYRRPMQTSKSHLNKASINQSSVYAITRTSSTAPRASCEVERLAITSTLCPWCRKFYTARSIAFHTKTCEWLCTNELQRRASLMALKERSLHPPKKPPGTLCFLCGRRYTSCSYDLHVQNCISKWRSWNARLPNKLQRAQEPTKPVPTKEDLMKLVEEAKARGQLHYDADYALDEFMYRASLQNALPLEFL